MKTFIQFLHKSFLKSGSTTVDPVRSFFVGGETKAKKQLYEKALRAAEVDQKKVITEYYKKAEQLKVDFDREEDGRWIAEIPKLKGVMAYGSTKKEALQRVYTIARSKASSDKLSK